MATNTDRNEILANFQACTSIEDFDECLAHLEQNDWNLHEAINSVLKAQSSDSPTTQPELPEVTEVPVVKSSKVTFASEPQVVFPSTSSREVDAADSCAGPSKPPAPKIRMLQFAISFRGRVVPHVVEDNRTVGVIKDLLAEELKLPRDKMKITGWSSSRVEPHDEELLSRLHLPLVNQLKLYVPDMDEPSEEEEEANGEDSFAERLSQSYILEITDTDENHVYSLRYEGSKTIFDVKQGVYALTNIPQRQQKWGGWCIDSDDSLTLAASGINHPKHILTLSRTTPKPEVPARTEAITVDGDSSDDEEFQDANETLDSYEGAMYEAEEEAEEMQTSRKFDPLIPPHTASDAEALQHFSREFEQRYGTTHPSFYLGSLEDAIKEAFNGSAKERKLLALYIHHDKSIFSNVFCSQVLCADSVVSFLSQNFVTWAWDVTEDSNKDRVMEAVKNQFGSVTMATIRNLPPDKFPALVIIMRLHSNTQVFYVSQGDTSLDELMTNFVNAAEVFNEGKQTEIQMEEERESSERLKQEQDLAYQESLIVDRAKAEEKEKQEQEELEKMRIEHEEQLQRQEHEEAIRRSLEEQLTDEPPEDCSEPMTTLRMRLPNGETLIRRFLANERMQMVLNFLGSQGFNSENHKVLTTWPKKDLTTIDTNQSFKDLALCPQETLFVEER
ncbi:FAS-associated factor 1-like [Apostichopus japonicus]|uniref:FAS-associated factor 1-like n=1 Tax=Stichopus japonicus TaxID=307972 RepID=UPI003AB56370